MTVFNSLPIVWLRVVDPVGQRKTWQLALGIGLMVGFFATAVGLWIGAGRLYDDNVAGFARAPVGCDTTLDFSRTGEFILYVETTGQLDSVRGDCDATGVYDHGGDLPAVQLVLRGPAGEVIDLESSVGINYDTGEFEGSSQRRVQIDASGNHVLTVGPVDGPEFAVAIGRDPNDGVGVMRWGALGALISGLVLGGVFLVLGSRRSVDESVDANPWQPTSSTAQQATGWPSGPPGFPAPPPTTGATGVGAARPVKPPERNSPPMQIPWPDSQDEQRSPWAPPPRDRQ